MIQIVIGDEEEAVEIPTQSYMLVILPETHTKETWKEHSVITDGYAMFGLQEIQQDLPLLSLKIQGMPMTLLGH